MCQDNVKHGKNCTDDGFYFLCGVTTVGKIMLQHFTKKCTWTAELQSCSYNGEFG